MIQEDRNPSSKKVVSITTYECKNDQLVAV